MLQVFTIQPLGDFYTDDTAALVTINKPSTLTLNTRFQSSTFIPSRFLGSTSTVVPALLINTSSRPNSFSVAAIIARTQPSSLTSQRSSNVRAPSASASLAVALAASSLRLKLMTTS